MDSRQQDQNFLYRSMTLVMLGVLASRVLGFFREVSIAYRFGATWETDAYLVAVLLPTILFYAFSDALRNTFITVFTPYKKEKDAPLLLNTLALCLAGALLLLAILGVIFAPQLVFLLAPGFKGEPFRLTVELTRILVPGILFVGLSGLATGFLHSHHRFLIPALVNVPHNIIVIFSALFLSLRYGILGLAWGSLLALASQLLIQLPAVLRLPFPFRKGISLSHPGVKKTLSLLPPILLSSAVLELKHLLDRLFASFLQPGSIAALNYAERVYILPQAIFAAAVIIVLYPTLVELLAQKEMESFTRQIQRGLSLLFFILLPVSIGLILLRRPLIELFFQRGAFDEGAAELTSYALLFYTPGLLGFALHYFCNRIYFALQEVKLLAWINLAMVGANALFNFLLMPYLGCGGIALGTTLAFTLGSLTLFLLFTRRLNLSLRGLLLAPLYRSALPAGIMTVFLLFFFRFWEGGLQRSPAGLAFCTVAICLGAVAYFASAGLLRLPEMGIMISFLKSLSARGKN